MTQGRSRIFPIPLDNVLASKQLYNRPCLVHGIGVKETTGTTAAVFNLRGGSGTSGILGLPYTLSGGQSVREWFGEAGLTFVEGLFLEVVTGTVTGCVWVSDHEAKLVAELDLHDLVEMG